MRRLPSLLLLIPALAAGCHASPPSPAAGPEGPTAHSARSGRSAAPLLPPALGASPVAASTAPAAPAVPVAVPAGQPAGAGAGLSAPDFATAVRPIFERRCTPCHFPGGKMYDALPFDDPATFHELGTRVLGRLDDADERATVEAYLASGS